MKPSQSDIYYFAEESKEHILQHPTLQKLLAKDYEVLLLDDPLDEFAVKYLEFYNGKPLVNVGVGTFKLPDEDKSEKKVYRKLSKIFRPLTKWWKGILEEEVEEVRISRRLVNDPVVLIGQDSAFSANMERITKSQSFSFSAKTDKSSYIKKILEINPDHVAIQELLSRVQDNPSKETEELATLLYYSACINSGFSIKDPSKFSAKFFKLFNMGIGLDRDATLKPFEVEIDENELEEEQEAPKSE